jgi:hypothetical protein
VVEYFSYLFSNFELSPFPPYFFCADIARSHLIVSLGFDAECSLSSRNQLFEDLLEILGHLKIARSAGQKKRYCKMYICN